jgi:endonuclease YncB( thermonuclease family)
VGRLSEDLEMNVRTLWQCVAFRREYGAEIVNRSVQNLTWSKYRILIGVHDKEARAYYQKRVVEEDWGGARLKKAIAGKEYERIVKKDKSVAVLKRPTGAGYVFDAEVLRVIDGDSILMELNCGFFIKKTERIRLAKLDAPEQETKKGKDATHYVNEQLAKAARVVVKTEKTDVFGRYLGHVFYSYEEDSVDKVYAEGRYLNDELLKMKLAERM